MLREGLIFLRRKYTAGAGSFQKLMLAVLAVSVVVSFVADLLLPFQGWANALRALIIIPLATSLFSLAYLYSMSLHDRRVADEEDWVPFRLRWSRTWRRRMAAVAGAFLFILVYASSYRPGYTLIAAGFCALAVALVAFIRPTRRELRMEELDIPDARDVLYDRKVKERTQEREASRKLKEGKRMKNRLRPRKDTLDD